MFRLLKARQCTLRLKGVVPCVVERLVRGLLVQCPSEHVRDGPVEQVSVEVVVVAVLPHVVGDHVDPFWVEAGKGVQAVQVLALVKPVQVLDSGAEGWECVFHES